jgi:hypothetical protein
MRSGFVTVLVSLFLFSCCSDEPSGPQLPAPLDTASHDFTWEVDTLPAGFFEGKTLYGTNASNVYLAGYSTSGHDNSWHWDGSKWERLDFFGKVGSIIDVDGLDSNYVIFLGDEKGSYSAGEPNMVVYQNNMPTTIAVPKGDRWRTCIRVVSRNEIYLGGFDGVQRYNGTDWEWLQDSTDMDGNQLFIKDIYKHDDGVLEFTSHNYTNPSEISLWQWTDDHFTKVDSFYTNEQGMNNIRFGFYYHNTESGVLSCSSGGIYERSNGLWIKINEQGGTLLAGSKNNLFTGSFQNLIHFNGDSWQDIFSEIKLSHPNIQLIYSLFYSDGVIFVSALESNRGVVFRGKQVEE